MANAVAEGHITVVPEVLVTGGGGGGGALDGLAATLMRTFGAGNGVAKVREQAAVTAPPDVGAADEVLDLRRSSAATPRNRPPVAPPERQRRLLRAVRGAESSSR